MSIHRFGKLALCGTALALCTVAGAGPPARADAASSATAVSDTWPHAVPVPDASILIYQPQVESWQGNELRFRAAVAITRTGSSEETFGVIWATTRTEVDPVTRQVVLQDLRLTRSHFPTLADDGAAYRRELQEALPKGDRTISLDRLEASLAAGGTVDVHHVTVDNTPPKIIVSYVPAVLIPVDGEPVIHEVPGTWFERVVNSQALIIRELGHKTYFLHLYDGWVTAETLDGPWTRAASVPPGADQLAKDLAAKGEVDLLDGGPAKPSLAHGLPVVHVSETPTELVVFKGQPDFQPIGTHRSPVGRQHHVGRAVRHRRQSVLSADLGSLVPRGRGGRPPALCAEHRSAGELPQHSDELSGRGRAGRRWPAHLRQRRW